MITIAEIEQLQTKYMNASTILCDEMRNLDDSEKRKEMKKDFNELQKLVLAILKYKVSLQLRCD